MSTELIDRGWKKILKNMTTVSMKSVVVGTLGDIEYASWLEFGTTSHLGNQKMPPRPFMRQTFELYGKNAEATIAAEFSLVLAGRGDAKKALDRVGFAYRGYIQKTIRNGSFAALHPYTIKMKGSDKPLINTGRLIGAINYEIR